MICITESQVAAAFLEWEGVYRAQTETERVENAAHWLAQPPEEVAKSNTTYMLGLLARYAKPQG